MLEGPGLIAALLIIPGLSGFLVGRRTIDYLQAFRFTSALTALLEFLQAASGGALTLYPLAAWAFGVQVLVIPYLNRRYLAPGLLTEPTVGLFNPGSRLILTIFWLLAGFGVGSLFQLPALYHLLFVVGLTVIFITLWAAVLQKQLIAQFYALLAAENGFILVDLGLTLGHPASLVELLAAFDLLFFAAVALTLVNAGRLSLRSPASTDSMRRLRG